MKKILTITVLTLGLAVLARAAETVTLSGVHICCHSCVNGVNKAVAGIDGLTCTPSQEESTVVLNAPDNATLQKGVDALVAAGFFGASSNPDVKVNATTGAKDQTVQTLKVDGVHLCCGKCVKGLNAALATVSGVTTNTATKGAATFEITGNFNDKAVFDALQKAGFTGKEE